jgi:hypothetical protein
VPALMMDIVFGFGQRDFHFNSLPARFLSESDLI